MTFNRSNDNARSCIMKTSYKNTFIIHALLAIVPMVSAEDVFSTYRIEDLRHLANTASIMDQMSVADAAEYLSLWDAMLVKKKAGGSLEAKEEKRLFDLSVKAAGSIERAELEVAKIAGEVTAKLGFSEQPKYKNVEEMEVFRKKWIAAKKVDITGEIQAALLLRILQKSADKDKVK